MTTNLSLNLITERPVVRNDEVSELDAVIEISTLGYSTEKQRQPLNLCIVIDRSGSMQGTKLETAKRSCIDIFKRLDTNDLYTVLVFDNDAYIVVNPQTPREKIEENINSISPGGSTNLAKGWYLGLLELQTYKTERHISRLILLSDGQANEGETKKSVLGNESAQARELGISTSTIGIGSDFQEELLEVLASESGGRFWYIGETKIEDIINEEFKGSLSVVLERPRIELILPTGVSTIKELNKLRKISGKYVVRPITGQDSLCFAVRLEFEPDKINTTDVLLEAKLYDADRLLIQNSLKLPLTPYNEFVISEDNPLVSRVVQQFAASTTDEKMMELVPGDDVETMKDMLEQQIGDMKTLEGMLKGEKAKNWDEELERLGKEEVERRKAEALRMAQELEELQSELAENQSLMVVVELIDLMKSIGQEQEVYHLVMRWRKIMMHRRHKKDFDRKRHEIDDHILKDFLQEALELVNYTVNTQQPSDPRLILVREKIREQMERHN